MTISVDTDGDGTPDATFPLRWGLVLMSAVAAACGFSRLMG